VIAATATVFDVLKKLAADGYSLTLEDDRIKVKGPAPLSDEQRALIKEHRDQVKAAILLADPPAWLETLEVLWFSGEKTTVLRTNPPTGKAENYEVSVSVREISTAVAAAVGMDPLRWEEIREEVEEALALFEDKGTKEGDDAA